MNEKKPLKASFIMIGTLLLAMLIVVIGISTVGLFTGSPDYENNHSKKVAPENRMYEFGN